MKKRLLTIGHSYVVALNRRISHEIAAVGKDAWDVTCVTPKYFHGLNDIRPQQFKMENDETLKVISVPAYFTNSAHCFFYDWRIKDIFNEGWDLIYCWEEPYVVAGFQLGCMASRGTPIIYHTLQNIYKSYIFPFNLIERYSVNKANGFICCGQTVKNNLQNRPGYQCKPLQTIPLGVDVELFNPNPVFRDKVLSELNWSHQGPLVVGFLGRFTEEKGVRLLMNAIDRMQVPCRFLWVGTGSLESDIRKWAKKKGDRVRIVTNAVHADVPKYLNVMDILCAPSQTVPHWREQFGRMIIEAFSCGVPVIGSDSGEISYVIGDAGVIVGEKDEDAWVRALEKLLSDHQLRADFSQRGRKMAEEKYSWKIVARQYLNFFGNFV
jgi:glycosyltransferase involved in cell wall biosynthesis